MALHLNGECKLNICAGGDESRNRQSVRKGEIWTVNKRSYIVVFVGKVWKLGKEDSRRVIHSVKVGLALSLVSLLYLMDPLFTGVGDTAIWAVLTVVVVHEFTAGATLSKGLNRGFGTLAAGSLATGVSYLSEQAGEPGEAILIGFTVFVLGAAASFSRFFPVIKRKYDYGVLIFILTFNLITVSGYRVDDIFRMAHQRLSTIAIGCGVCLVTSLLIYPIWAGEDLHNFTADKFEGLATSLEVCVQKYFDGSNNKIDEDEIEREQEDDDSIYERYKPVLDSKAMDESLATFASWEPRHGRFRHRHPWKHYVKMGSKLRHLAYAIVALHGSLQSEIQTPHSVRSVLKKPCTKVSEEAAKLLRELSCSIRHMRRCDSESMIGQLKLAVDDLHTAFRAQPKLFVDSRRWHIEENGSEIERAEDQLTKEEVVPKGDSKTNLFRRVVSLQDQPPDHEKIHTHSGVAEPCTNLFKRVVSQSHAEISAKPRQSVEYAEALPLATFAWLMVEVVARVEHVVEAVEELGSLAHFKACKPTKQLTTATPPQTPKQSKGRIVDSHIATQYGAE